MKIVRSQYDEISECFVLKTVKPNVYEELKFHEIATLIVIKVQPTWNHFVMKILSLEALETC